MDIRHFFQDFLLLTLLINIQPGLSYIEDDMDDEESFSRCPWIRNKLKNGRVRYRYRGRVAKFLCDSGYDLAGKRSSTCVRGQWSNPVPVCVARGCSRVPTISNGHVTEMYRGAVLVYDCNPGYTLDGVASIHCDGRRWSSSPPACVVATENPEMYCDFESSELCGWSHDPNHDFDWKRNQFATPSGHAGTGPAFDHTFGESKGGYYLYIEASSPRKINDTARLFSPVYPAGMSGGCFLFWYHMYGATTGGLRVYLKPESHVFDELSPKWEKFGEQGNQWNRGNISIPVLHENFQIVIEGIRGESYVGDSAIDDVSLTTQDCESMANDTGFVDHTDTESCRGRCREAREDESEASCSCNDHCYFEHNCCSDYGTFCFEGNETTVHNPDETSGAPLSKTSPVPSTSADTSNPPEEYTPIVTVKPTSKSSTETAEAFTSSTILQTLPISASVSNTSASSSEVPLYVSSTSTTIITSTKLPSTTIQTTNMPSTSTTSATIKSSTTSIPTSTSSPKPTTRSSTSVGTTKISTTPVETTTSSTTSVETTTSSTIRTTISSTTTNSKTSVQTTLTSVTPMRSTATTTTTEKTTLPSTLTTINFTTPIAMSIFISSSPQITEISSRLPNTTAIVESTTTSSLVPSSSVTTEPSTRKTYNLRPRTQRTTTPVSTVTYGNTKTESVTQRVTDTTVLPKTTSVASSTGLNGDIATFPAVKSSTTMYHTTWHNFPVTSPYVVTKTRIRQSPTTSSTTKVPDITSTSRQYIRQTTNRYTHEILRFTSTQNPSSYPATSDSYQSGTSKTETTASSSSVPVVISLLVIIVIIAAGVAYYMRKQKDKRQSKLSDDSEMRFLQENEYMEYSDASVLDRILVK